MWRLVCHASKHLHKCKGVEGILLFWIFPRHKESMAIKCIHHPLQSALIVNESTSLFTGRVSRSNVDTFTRSNVNYLSVAICISRPVKAQASLFPFSKKKDRALVKEELLEAIAPLDRGADATPDDQYRVEKVAILNADSSLYAGNCWINIPYAIAESLSYCFFNWK